MDRNEGNKILHPGRWFGFSFIEGFVLLVLKICYQGYFYFGEMILQPNKQK